MFGVSLQSLLAERMLEADQLYRRTLLNTSRLPMAEVEQLNYDDGESTKLPVFVLGLHNIDDTKTSHWIP